MQKSTASLCDRVSMLAVMAQSCALCGDVAVPVSKQLHLVTGGANGRKEATVIHTNACADRNLQ